MEEKWENTVVAGDEAAVAAVSGTSDIPHEASVFDSDSTNDEVRADPEFGTESLSHHDEAVFHQYNPRYANIEGNDKRYAYRFVKRLTDIVFSALVIAVLFIPSLILSLIIAVDSKGSPLYCQKRVGRHGKEFTMYKFRSMVKGADTQLDQLQSQNEADGPLFKIENDPRMTRIGRFLRKHSIDELPQFINSFIGNMSVVGPRPALPKEVVQYNDYVRQRLYVKPGITGYWQTRGRSSLPFSESIDLDLAYIEESSPMVDIKCILKTIPIMINGKGSY